MKKVRTLLLSLLCFISVTSFGQLTSVNVGSSTPIPGGKIVKGPLNAIVEPEESVLSYLPSGWTMGYTSDAKYGFICYQSFSGVSRSFNTITVWAVNSSYSNPIAYDLVVKVYNPGETSSTLGVSAVPVSSTTAHVVPVATGESLGLYSIYSYTIQIPITNLSSGWISVCATNSVPQTFYWLNTVTAPANSCYQLNGESREIGLSMCLSNSHPVPVSVWSILAGFVLIGGAITFRFWRKLF
jgi:hypothetical protein